jgi:rare lipoprotein A
MQNAMQRPTMKCALLAFVALFPTLSAAAHDGDPIANETGIASWYGYPYHGRQAAGGEIYDMELLTAAHRTLPFGTRVRVVNLRNARSVEVRINDRGPFIDGRIIDLSRAAAGAVDMLIAGIDPVRVEVIGIPDPPGPELFAVQVGAFQDHRNAERYLALLLSKYPSGRIVARDGYPTLWRVLVGSELTHERATVLAARLRLESPEHTAFVTRLDP